MYQLQRKESSEFIGAPIDHFKERMLAEQARLQGELRGRWETLHNGPTAVEDQVASLHDQLVSIRQTNFSCQKIKVYRSGT